MSEHYAFLARLMALLTISWALAGLSVRGLPDTNALIAHMNPAFAERHMNQVHSWLVHWKDAIASIQSLVTIAAIVVGGLFAYYKLFKGRTYVQRLEPSLAVSVLDTGEYTCAIVSTQVKNVGASRVDIDRDASKMQICLYTEEDYAPEFHNAYWHKLGTVDAMVHHAWVEPGETVTEDRLFALPNFHPIAVRVRLRLLPLVSRFRRTRSEWNALAIGARRADDKRFRVQSAEEAHHERSDQEATAGRHGRDTAAEGRGGTTTA